MLKTISLKKTLGLILTLAIVFALTVPSFAAFNYSTKLFCDKSGHAVAVIDTNQTACSKLQIKLVFLDSTGKEIYFYEPSSSARDSRFFVRRIGTISSWSKVKAYYTITTYNGKKYKDYRELSK